jgi:hypothetical protein
MVRIAVNEKNPIELRAWMFGELPQYVAPMRRRWSTRHSPA